MDEVLAEASKKKSATYANCTLCQVDICVAGGGEGCSLASLTLTFLYIGGREKERVWVGKYALEK